MSLVSDLNDTVTDANSAKGKIYGASVSTDLGIDRDAHDTALEQLHQLEQLAEFLPFAYWRKNNQIATDPASNAPTIRHVDFTSGGRGGLSFSLERIYSPIIAYTFHGDVTINETLRQYFTLLRNIVGSVVFKNSTLDFLESEYRARLIEARNIYNTSRGVPPNSGPQYEDTSIFPGIDELIDWPSLSSAYRAPGAHELWLGIQSDDDLVRVDDLPNGPFDSSLRPDIRIGNPINLVAIHLKLVRDKFLQLIATKTAELDATLASMSGVGGVSRRSTLGCGWTLNIPFLRPPDPTHNRKGYLVFDGYIIEELQYEYKEIPAHNGFFHRLPATSLPVKINGTDEPDVAYAFRSGKRIWYFDLGGELRFISDLTHQNTIRFSYELVYLFDSLGMPVTLRRIKQITDAAGNTYNFSYDSNYNLQHISASYGKRVTYDVRRSDGSSNSISVDEIPTVVFQLASATEVGHSTSWRYANTQVFDCAALNTPVTISLPLLIAQGNPLGAENTFFYHSAPLTTVSAGISSNSLITPDPNLSFSIAPHFGRLQARTDVGLGRVIEAHPLISVWNSVKTSVTLTLDRAIEYEYRKASNGLWQLRRRTTRVLHWSTVLGYLPNEYRSHVGAILLDETFSYTYDGLLERTTLSRGDPQSGSGARYWVREMIYGVPDTEPTRSLGLPLGEVFYEGTVEQRRVEYLYYWSPYLLMESKGDTKHYSYLVFQDDRDPAGSGNPTEARENRSSSPFRISTKFWYDKYGNLIKRENPLGRITRYEYAANGSMPAVYLSKIIEDELVGASGSLPSAPSLEITFTRDAVGRVTKVIDQRGFQTEYTYDDYGRLTRSDVDGRETLYEYGALGSVPAGSTRIRRLVTAASGSASAIYYISRIDGDSRLALSQYVNVTDNISTSCVVDENYRLRSMVRQTGATVTIDFDSLGRVTKVRNLLGGVTQTVYDDVVMFRNVGGTWVIARTVAVTDPEGFTTTSYLDVFDRVVAVHKTVDFEGVASPAVWIYRWDRRNRLEWSRDPDNSYEEFTYDESDRLLKRKRYQSPSGEYFTFSVEETFSHNVLHQTKRAIDAKGYVTDYEFDGFDRLKSIMRNPKDLMSFGYDGSDNITSVNHNGCITKRTYSATNKVISLTDPENNTWAVGYDLLDRVISIVEPEAGTPRWTYDSRDNITQHVDADGNAWTYLFDKDNGLKNSWEPRGAPATRYYSSYHDGAVSAVVDAAGHRTDIVRDKLSRPIRVYVHDVDAEYLYSYNAHGKLATATAPDGSVWRYGYDRLGRLIRRTSPEGRIETSKYDHRGRLRERSRGNGLTTWRFDYDDNDNRTFAENPLGGQEHWTYDSLNRVSTWTPYGRPPLTYAYSGDRSKTIVTDSNGNPIQYTFDKNGLVRTMVDQENTTITLSYDKCGRTNSFSASKGADSYSETYTRYPSGRLKQIDYADGSNKQFTYDPNGNLDHVYDEEGWHTQYWYGSVTDKPTLVRGPEGVDHNYTYDGLGRPTKVTENGAELAIKYEDSMRKVTFENATGNRIGFKYSPDGNLVKRIYSKPFALDEPIGCLGFFLPLPVAPCTTYGFDAANRLSEVNDPEGGTTKYYRNALSQLERVEVNGTPSGESVTYNTDGTVQTVQTLAGTSYWYYFPDGSLDRVTWPDGSWTRYTWYLNGKVQRREQSSGMAKDFTYDHSGQVSSVMEDGNSIYFSRDNRLRVDSERTLGVSSSTVSFQYLKNGTLSSIGDTQYQYANGRLSKATLNGNSIEFTYDVKGRVQRQSAGGFFADYTYDDNGRIATISYADSSSITLLYDSCGNPTKVIRKDAAENENVERFKYDKQSRLTSWKHNAPFSQVLYAYDARGNLLSEADNSGSVSTRIFDSDNRLQSITRDGASQQQFFYDVHGNVSHIDHADGTYSDFVFDDENRLRRVVTPDTQLLLSYDAADRLVREQSPSSTVDIINAGTFPVTYGAPGAFTSNIPNPNNGCPIAIVEPTRFVIPGWCLGSSSVNFADNGAQIDAIQREPYGDAPGAGAATNPFAFKGYRQLGQLGLHATYTRVYSAEHRVFLTPDILRGYEHETASMNRYHVFNSNPLRYIDALGLQDESDEGGESAPDYYIDLSDTPAYIEGDPYAYTDDFGEFDDGMIGISTVFDVDAHANEGPYDGAPVGPATPHTTLIDVTRNLSDSVNAATKPLSNVSNIPTQRPPAPMDSPTDDSFNLVIPPYVDYIAFPLGEVFGDPVGSAAKALESALRIKETERDSPSGWLETAGGLIALYQAGRGVVEGLKAWGDLRFALRFSSAWNTRLVSTWANSAWWQPRLGAVLELRAAATNLRAFTSTLGPVRGTGIWLRTVGEQTLRVAMGPKAYASAQTTASVAVTGGAIIGAVGSLVLLEQTIEAVRQGERPPIDVAGDFWVQYLYDGMYEDNWQLKWR